MLFVAGYSGVTLYFNVIKPGSSFQATGSLAMLLVWVYFNALLVLIGAEFTRTWSKRPRRKSNG
jgi:membrane protein